MQERTVEIRAQALKRREELVVNPETIRGYVFRVPSLVGLGTGRGFDVANIHLPIGWQKALPQLQALNPEDLQQTLQRICEIQKVPEGSIDFDQQSGLLKTVTIGTNPASSLSLFNPYSARLSSEYSAYSITDINVAVALQEFVISEYLATIGKTLGSDQYYGFIRGRGPRNLRIPKNIWASKKPVLNKHQIENVQDMAHNIAGRFGENIEDLNFNERGVLEHVRVNPEASYHLDKFYGTPDTYGPHNVADLYQAAALQGIVAHFINKAIESREKVNHDIKPRYNPNV